MRIEQEILFGLLVLTECMVQQNYTDQCPYDGHKMLMRIRSQRFIQT